MPDVSSWYDITRPVFNGMPVWPGDAPCRISWTACFGPESPVNVSELSMSAHCGTHVDAPLHVLEDGGPVGSMPLEVFTGVARVIDAREWEEIDDRRVGELLAEAQVERLLFRTGCWRDPRTFPERFPAITAAAAEMLRDQGLRLVGTDAPSVDPFTSETLPAHRVLAEAGIAIVENLLLNGVPAGVYELFAFPLRLTTADAAPVRAVLRRP